MFLQCSSDDELGPPLISCSRLYEPHRAKSNELPITNNCVGRDTESESVRKKCEDAECEAEGGESLLRNLALATANTLPASSL